MRVSSLQSQLPPPFAGRLLNPDPREAARKAGTEDGPKACAKTVTGLSGRVWGLGILAPHNGNHINYIYIYISPYIITIDIYQYIITIKIFLYP